MKPRLYTYAWKNNPKRATMKGRVCRLLACMKMSSVVVRFVDNGQVEVTDRKALRRAEG